MNPWTRLTDGAGTEFERLLLDSAQDDAAPLASRQHVAAQLGVDLARVEASAALMRSAPVSNAVGLTKAGLEPASAGALAKCTLIAVIGGLSAFSARSEVEVVSAPMVEVRMATEEVAAPAEVAAARVPAALIEPAMVPESTESTRTLTAPEPPNRPRKSVPRGRKPVTVAVDAPNGVEPEATLVDPLVLEVRELDRVRSALGSGRTLEALRTLDTYETKFPRGALRLEAAVLRVRTLERAGRFAHAARLAREALELPGSERYRSELTRVAGGEDTQLDKDEQRSTLKGSR